MASAAAGQKALPTIAFKHTTAAATVASVSAPILLDIGRDLSPSPPRPAAGDAACCTALLPAITGGEHSLALPPSAYLSHQTPLQPQIPCRLQHVIANQCAHWCGNPRPRRETWQVGCCFGEFVCAFRICPKCYFSSCTAAENTDCHVASLLAMTRGDVLAPANTYPSSACHCEPVRTLVRQSASPQRYLTSWLL